MKSNIQHQSSQHTTSLNKSTQQYTKAEVCQINTNTEHPNTICAGQHLIFDFWGAEHLQDIDLIDQALRAAAEAAGAELLHIHLHKFSGAGGVTGVALLAESHISIHTWPEYNYAAFDVFMCGSAEPEKSAKILEEVFKPKKIDQSLLMRGQLHSTVKTEE